MEIKKDCSTESIFISSDIQEYYMEYDEMMLGNRAAFSAFFMNKDKGDKNIIATLKYVFEQYLNWTPEQVRDELTP